MCSLVMVRIVACVVPALVCSLPAFGNKTHYQDIRIERLLAASDAVVAAQPEGSPRAVLEEITPAGEKPDAAKWPAFAHAVHRYQIDEVLFDRTMTLNVGATIDVDAADWQSELHVHKLYYLEGRAKSPLY